mmetsp:Transcript_34324/g.43333  ORF Transcript_34324/g.43333 Transcript_34324/m.43333 type:complete len:787 (-) Transcript_34324:4-2364(-)
MERRAFFRIIFVYLSISFGSSFLKISGDYKKDGFSLITSAKDPQREPSSRLGTRLSSIGSFEEQEYLVDQHIPPRQNIMNQQQELSLGAPRYRPEDGKYVTKGGVKVKVQTEDVLNSQLEVDQLIDALDSRKGVLLSSSYEFPGRYARWTIGLVDPPVEFVGSGRKFTVKALNERGTVLLPAFQRALDFCRDIVEISSTESTITGRVRDPEPGVYFPEEERSKQPSLFTVVRKLVNLMYYEGDPQLGLYGALGYDLTFQFDPIDLYLDREEDQKDLVLFLPDQILVVDQVKQDAWKLNYDFSYEGKSTEGMPRTGLSQEFVGRTDGEGRDTPKGKYAERVELARKEFACGNLFECVLSQTFKHPCPDAPSQVFRRLQTRNPAPYGLFLNLGDGEYLVGASPEMFVRCEKTSSGLRVETCPISGTIARGKNALEDAQQIKEILGNLKEESELTMCTDVDRNDKSRICVPGSVQVLGRRQIEMYSRLIHTVDHVEGYLRPEFDALDAFLCHTWAVTVTGAPKTWAIQFIEKHESSPRHWYGGAVGLLGFDGHMNTGLTLRTVRIKDGLAEVRAGATLLYDSTPIAEEKETELKASAMIDAVIRPDSPQSEDAAEPLSPIRTGMGKKVLLIDHQDSFVHTLGNYIRQTGAEVMTIRSGPNAWAAIDEGGFDMVVLSPGPGNPSDFNLKKTMDKLIKAGIPAFGVCLGLQGMVEYFGGTLDQLSYPMHGKPSTIKVFTPLEDQTHKIFEGIPEELEIARYHSLYGKNAAMPDCLQVLASTEDNIVKPYAF